MFLSTCLDIETNQLDTAASRLASLARDKRAATALVEAGAHTDYVTTLGETIRDAGERSPRREEMLALLASHGIEPIR